MTIRVLIAEDSPTTRVLLTEILSSDPGLEVVGDAANGREAIERTRQLRPDIVVMDVRMPVLDGFEATKEIMIEVPTPIVIVSASQSVREVETSMHALRAGALTILAKPPGPDDPGFEEACRRFVETVKAMAGVKVVRHWRGPRPAGTARAPRPGSARIVAVAASTGGPAALHALVSALRPDFDAPVVVVQHIAPGYVSGLASWLDTASSLRIKVAEDREVPCPRMVYLAPDGRHLVLAQADRFELRDGGPVSGFLPSADVLFESVARAYGPRTLAIVLTGMGQDGVQGLRAIREAGGRVLVQDEATSVVFGMPRAAIAAGLADTVLPLCEIPSLVTQWVREV